MNVALALPLADSWGMHGDVDGGWWILMMVVMLLFWGAVIAGIFWLIRGATWGRSATERPRREETAMEILDRRFAEGEISEEDYLARREVLGAVRP